MTGAWRVCVARTDARAITDRIGRGWISATSLPRTLARTLEGRSFRRLHGFETDCFNDMTGDIAIMLGPALGIKCELRGIFT